MTTVGYGDLTPINNFEILLSIIAMLVATGIFSYSFNKIGILVQEISS